MSRLYARSFSSILFCAGAFAAGCTDDLAELEGEAPSGETASELVGGTATIARPEVGTFNNGAGGGCTATLISPRVVAVAAHCLSPMYTATTVASGAVFQFTDRSGVFRSYSVDRVHSFATKRFEYVPQGTFTTDLAILHLSAQVPIEQAIPADLAHQEPTTGAQSTIFGFGCTDRTPASGGGFKQFRTFNFGTSTTALCWGDSGGPVVYGPVSGGGAIWGVNSDFNFVGGTDDWTDIFAAAPFYRKQIEDLMRAWDGVNEVGWNRPGMDYANVASASAWSCRASCESDARCAAFTWTPEGASGRCWLKDGAPEPYLAWDNAVVSGLPSKYEYGYNRGGADYSWFTTANAEQCAAACGRDTICHAWTHVSSSSMCWLKSSAPARSACSTCTSGVVRRELETNHNRPGHDYAVRTASSAQDCANQCAREDRCEAYTHTGPGANNCWLKDAVPWAGPATGMTSGVRGGLETNTNRWGGDYRSFTTTRLSPTVCQAACAAEAPCQAWTYVPPSSTGTTATCWLKSSIPGRSFGAGLVSGIKGLEMLH